MKAGRVRCGQCQRVLYNRGARRGWDRDGQAAQHWLEQQRKLRPLTGEELEALAALRHGPGETPDQRQIQHHLIRGVGYFNELFCRRCSVRYRVDAAELRRRIDEALARGEDLYLVNADKLR